MIVEEVRKLRPDDFRPTEKLIVQLMQSMIARGLKDHPAFEELWCLLGELVPLDPDRDDLGRHMHHVLRVPGPYVDMAKAEALYQRWCRTHGVTRASMSRNAKVMDGNKQDAPCLVFVAGKLGLPTYVVAKAWRSRKKLKP